MSHLEQIFAHHCQLIGLAAPVREHRFHPRRKWRFDFAWPEKQIAVEIEGGTYKKGRHNRPQGFESDVNKYNAATLAGWKVYRFTSLMVRNGHAAKFMEEVMNST